jgi:hypothetical protein
MAEPQYHRLTWGQRRRSGVIAYCCIRSSLWLGGDHLLVIDSTGYAESYKRFHFRDTQAVSIRLSRRRLIWNWVLGVPTAVCLVGWGYDLLVTRSISLGGIITGVTVTLLFAVPLLINNLLGPTCVCCLRTAVQTEEVPSLGRVAKARRILDRLRPLIAQAQGQLAPEEIPARVRSWKAATTTASAAVEERYVVDDPNLPPRIVS